MYIRLRKNLSGTVSVLLVSSKRSERGKNPSSMLVKSFGSSADVNELENMRQEAEKFKSKLMMSDDVSCKRMLVGRSADIVSCLVESVGVKDVYGNIFDIIFSDFHFNKKNNLLKNKLKNDSQNSKNIAEKNRLNSEIISQNNISHKDFLKEIAIMRIANPASKLRTSQIASDYGFNLPINDIYRFMDSLDVETINKLKCHIFNFSKKLLSQSNKKLDVIFYDLTTIYFETNRQNKLRDFGFSKDGKHQHVQITLAMMVTNDGLPVGYETFIGNTYEGNTLIPVLQTLKKKYDINNVCLVADSALMSKINLDAIVAEGFNYIICARIRNLKNEIKKQILDEKNYEIINDDLSVKKIDLLQKFDDGFDWKSDGKSSVNSKNLVEYSLSKPEKSTIHHDNILFSYFSKSRQRKDIYDRELSLKKIAKHVGSSAKNKLTGILKKSYVELSADSAIKINQSKLEKSAEFDGYFGFCTNIKNPDPVAIAAQYKGLWQIEQTFRINKHNLKIRPVFHYVERRIEAHFVICYVALMMARVLEYRLKQAKNYITLEQLHVLLSKIQTTKIVTKITNPRTNIDEMKQFNITSDFPVELAKVYSALGIRPRKRFC